MSHAPKVYVLTYIALLVLLGATVAAALADLGAADIVISMTIAVVKAVLVAWFFMHLQHEQPLVRIVAAAGVLWLLLLFIFLAADYATREPGRPLGWEEAGRLVEFAPHPDHELAPAQWPERTAADPAPRGRQE